MPFSGRVRPIYTMKKTARGLLFFFCTALPLIFANGRVKSPTSLPNTGSLPWMHVATASLPCLKARFPRIYSGGMSSLLWIIWTFQKPTSVAHPWVDMSPYKQPSMLPRGCGPLSSLALSAAIVTTFLSGSRFPSTVFS